MIVHKMLANKWKMYCAKCSMKDSHSGMAELFRLCDFIIMHTEDVVINKGRPQGDYWVISFLPSHYFLTATNVKWHTKGFWQRESMESSGGPNGPVTKDTAIRRKKLRERKWRYNGVWSCQLENNHHGTSVMDVSWPVILMNSTIIQDFGAKILHFF